MSEFSFLDMIIQSGPGGALALVMTPIVIVLLLRQRREITDGRRRALEWCTVALLVTAAASAVMGRIEVAPWLGVGEALLVAAIAARGAASRGLLAFTAGATTLGVYLIVWRSLRLIQWWSILASGELGEIQPAHLAWPLAVGLGLALVALLLLILGLRPRVTRTRVVMLAVLLAAGALWLVPMVRARVYLALGAHGPCRDVLIDISMRVERARDHEQEAKLLDLLHEVFVDLLERDDPGLVRLSSYVDSFTDAWQMPIFEAGSGAGPRAQEKLELVLRESDDPELRRLAASNLASFDRMGEATQPALVAALDPRDPVLSRLAARALTAVWPLATDQLSNSACDALALLARSAWSDRQQVAIRALGRAGAESAVASEVLTELAVGSEDPVAGTSALIELARLQGEEALLALLSQLLTSAPDTESSEPELIGQVLALIEIQRLGGRAAALLPEIATAERSRERCETLNRVVSWTAWSAWLEVAPAVPEVAIPRLRRLVDHYDESMRNDEPIDTDLQWRVRDARALLERLER